MLRRNYTDATFADVMPGAARSTQSKPEACTIRTPTVSSSSAEGFQENSCDLTSSERLVSTIYDGHRCSQSDYDVPLSYSDHANRTLYDCLHDARLWQCLGRVPGHDHLIRLRLREVVETDRRQVAFDTAMSITDEHNDRALRWQQLRFLVPGHRSHQEDHSCRLTRQEYDRPRCDALRKCTTYSTFATGKQIEYQHFCQTLQERIGSARIRLELQDQTFNRRAKPERSDHGRIFHAPSVSLLDIETGSLHSSQKLVLAYILAKSVWQFYLSDWMRWWWKADRIHFMKEEPSYDDLEKTHKINLSVPYLVFHPKDRSEPHAVELYSGFVFHKYPRILALGILLVHIFKVGPDQFQTSKTGNTDELINDLFQIGIDAVNSRSWPHLDSQDYDVVTKFRNIVRKCFQGHEFEQPDFQHDYPVLADAEYRRDMLYQKIVCPLRRLLTDIGLLDDEGRVKNVQDYRSSVDLSAQHGPIDAATTIDRSGEEQGSTRWLVEASSTPLPRRLFLGYKNSDTSERIHIAVLDTGCDLETQFFQTPQRSRRFQHWIDMVQQSSTTPKDCNGHGTHVVSLAMRMAPSANISVARIADESNSLDTAADETAKAISWAVEKQCDIIIMSFGFTQRIPAIEQAISRAVADTAGHILFFAAAANEGGNQTELFPARLDTVIPIRATDHNGTPQWFNPPTDLLRRLNFMTLGTEVASAWLSSHPGDKCQTGTSVATPIAAGIAATILADARVMMRTATEAVREQLRRLGRHRGMNMVLYLLSCKRRYPGDLYYLYPHLFMQASEEERLAKYLVATSDV